jgi:hypothetical protein
MKKLVLAQVMVLASICLVSAPTLRAQDSGQITIQNPAEYNAYQQANTQTDDATKAKALEDFLTAYPQSVVKKAVLVDLIGTYRQLKNTDGILSAASRVLQIDPNNLDAIYLSVYLKKPQCAKTSDPQVCDDAAALAQKGLTVPKPADTSDADWKTGTDLAYPLYHSTIALDDAVSKKDFKAAIAEYKAELNMYTLPQTQSAGLADTLNLAEAYAKPGDSRDLVQACWFYARTWSFAPDAYKSQIEPKLEYYYKRYHGNLDGIDALKTASAASLYKPDSFTITPAPTPPEIVHNVLATTPDLTKLNLEDKEFILANGSKDDAQKLWAVLQNQATPVPGVVIDAPASVLKITATGAAAAAKPKEFVVKLTTPAACSAVPAAPTTVKEAQDYITANGVKADVDALGDVMTDAHLRKLEVVPAVGTIDVAVTQDAKDNKAADFIVSLKEPVTCKDAPAAGFEYKLQPADELDATYDTYTAVPATSTRPATAQIMLREGFIQAEKAKAAPVHHTAKPSAAHHTAN